MIIARYVKGRIPSNVLNGNEPSETPLLLDSSQGLLEHCPCPLFFYLCCRSVIGLYCSCRADELTEIAGKTFARKNARCCRQINNSQTTVVHAQPAFGV